MRDKLRKQPPMAWGQLGGRAVGPVLDVQLARRVQVRAELQYFIDVFLIVPNILLDIRRRHDVVKLLSRGQREGRDICPVRAEKRLPFMIVVDQRLPAIRIHDIRPGQRGLDEGVRVAVS